MSAMLAHVRIVLVRPSGATNVGSVARCMANMGLRELVLVAPECDFLGEQARAYAVRATGVLEDARVVHSIADALADCVRTYATTAKLGLYRRSAAVSVREAAREIVAPARGAAGAASPIAVAFGPEDRGLLLEETLQFDRIVTIPTDDSYPALNLAAAATIFCYELHAAALEAAGAPALPLAIRHDAATDQHKSAMFERLFEALDELGFFRSANPDHLRYALRHMLGRVDLSVNETDILIGVARQIQWYMRNHPRVGAAPPAAPQSEA